MDFSDLLKYFLPLSPSRNSSSCENPFQMWELPHFRKVGVPTIFHDLEN